MRGFKCRQYYLWYTTQTLVGDLTPRCSLVRCLTAQDFTFWAYIEQSQQPTAETWIQCVVTLASWSLATNSPRLTMTRMAGLSTFSTFDPKGLLKGKPWELWDLKSTIVISLCQSKIGVCHSKGEKYLLLVLVIRDDSSGKSLYFSHSFLMVVRRQDQIFNQA